MQMNSVCWFIGLKSLSEPVSNVMCLFVSLYDGLLTITLYSIQLQVETKADSHSDINR